MTVAVQTHTCQKRNRLKPLLIWLETIRNACSVAHTGCETWRFLPFASVRCVLKMPYVVRR